MKSKIALILMALACAFAAVPAHAEYTPEQIREWRAAANRGEAWAQYNLGVCYDNGDGVEKDLREAVRWYRKSAEQGLVAAQCNLGVCYEFGNGVEKDLREAVRWYRRAAEQGDARAQNNLGWRYKNGEGVEKNLEAAAMWWRKAAEQGDSDGQDNLGNAYRNGWGVSADAAEAFSWYRKSAEQGDKWGHFHLGECYAKGLGVKANRDEARRLFSLAAAQGLDEAKRALEGVDFFVPERAGTRGSVFVCVVANEDYSDAGADKVPHAVNDGKVFAEYARKTLGVPARNVHVATDATRGQMRRAERWLENAVRAYPDAEVVFYYAGHGVPVVKGDRVAKKCLLPTDVSAEDAELDAVDLDELLARLSRLGAKQVTVFLDACFSGTLDKGGRGVRMKAGPTEARGNMAVFAAASGDETALPLDAERHGLFTYCLLKKLQDTKGEVTWGELGEHLKRRVPQLAHEHGLSGTQTPTVSTSGGFDLDRRLTE